MISFVIAPRFEYWCFLTFNARWKHDINTKKEKKIEHFKNEFFFNFTWHSQIICKEVMLKKVTLFVYTFTRCIF